MGVFGCRARVGGRQHRASDDTPLWFLFVAGVLDVPCPRWVLDGCPVDTMHGVAQADFRSAGVVAWTAP